MLQPAILPNAVNYLTLSSYPRVGQAFLVCGTKGVFKIGYTVFLHGNVGMYYITCFKEDKSEVFMSYNCMCMVHS